MGYFECPSLHLESRLEFAVRFIDPDALTEHINQGSAATTQYLAHLQGLGATGQTGLAVVNQVLTREAMTLAVNDVFYGCGILFILLIPLLWLARPPFGNAGGAAAH